LVESNTNGLAASRDRQLDEDQAGRATYLQQTPGQLEDQAGRATYLLPAPGQLEDQAGRATYSGKLDEDQACRAIYQQTQPAIRASFGHIDRPHPQAVLRIRIHRIHMFLGLPDPNPLVRGVDPDPSIIMLK
jgi:hypothetical protein